MEELSVLASVAADEVQPLSVLDPSNLKKYVATVVKIVGMLNVLPAWARASVLSNKS